MAVRWYGGMVVQRRRGEEEWDLDRIWTTHTRLGNQTKCKSWQLLLRRDPHPIQYVTFAFARRAKKIVNMISREAQRNILYSFRAERGENCKVAVARSAEIVFCFHFFQKWDGQRVPTSARNFGKTRSRWSPTFYSLAPIFFSCPTPLAKSFWFGFCWDHLTRRLLFRKVVGREGGQG